MTNLQHHQFAPSVFRVTATLTLMILTTLAILAAPLASAQTFMFNRADFTTGVGPVRSPSATSTMMAIWIWRSLSSVREATSGMSR